MNCDNCSNIASVFLTRVVGSSLKKIALCNDCAESGEVIQSLGLESLLDSPTSELPDIPEPTPPSKKTNKVTKPITKIEELACRCGFTLEDISRIGRLGCPHCYVTFQDLLKERINKIQRGSQHTGKQLDIPMSEEMLERKQARLENELNSAIADEEFEKAAQLRDELESLSNQPSIPND